MVSNTACESEQFAALVAIDWADKSHVWALRAADSGTIEQGQIEHTPEAVHAWAAGLVQRFGVGGRRVAVALEQSRGALLSMLMVYESFVLYPVHPRSVALFRGVFSPSGAKDDPSDAQLLLELLRHHRDRLRRLEPDTVQTRTLQLLVEKRRQWVDEQTAQSNRLTAALKLYFSQILEWFDDVCSPLVGDLLLRWPTLEQLQKTSPEELRGFFHEHNCRRPARMEERLQQIRQATPAIADTAVIEACLADVRIAVKLIATLREGIAGLESRIAQLYAAHEDRPIFDSLPGAGQALSPRLLAALGSRRERYHTAQEIQCYSGIAPVLVRSGNKQWTHFRWACPKFLRQTFHEWAAQTIRLSPWARQYYEQLRSRGKSHHAAVRALAFKWIRILFRCWKDRVPYDEARYLGALSRRRSPKPVPLAPVNNPVNIQWETCAGFSKPVPFSS